MRFESLSCLGTVQYLWLGGAGDFLERGYSFFIKNLRRFLFFIKILGVSLFEKYLSGVSTSLRCHVPKSRKKVEVRLYTIFYNSPNGMLNQI